MSSVTIRRRSPAVYCRIKDILEGAYDEEKNVINTILGEIHRAKVVANVIYKSEKESSSNTDSVDDMLIKADSADKKNLSFLIDDGTGAMWINLWAVNPEHYKDIKNGDLIQVVGTIKRSNNKNIINTEFISKYSDPNFETLHILRILKHIKVNGIPENYRNINLNNNESEEQELDELITNGEIFNDSDLDSEDTKDFSDDFGNDEFEDQFDEDLIQERVLEFIKKNDKGSGVSIQLIEKSLSVPNELLEEIMRRLLISSKIFKQGNNNFSAN
ncbi:MAG: OB-fold nucleic acid binding domain-containing protein [Promethearchaeota archaeon]